MDKELAFYNYCSAETVMKELIENGYVCMMSREEELWILNYEYGEFYDDGKMHSDRNAVVFRSVENDDKIIFDTSNMEEAPF